MPVVATAGGLPTRLGKYEILLPLAAGGMARIYIARTTGIGMFERHVVLKVITPERENDVVAVQMFLDEARLAAALNHQNVAQVFEVGQDGGIHYLAMEYVHGQDLRALLAKAGSQGTRVPLELALTVVAGAAAGLNHAHERRGPDGTPLGIVHRDVSPSNIMIGYDGSVKLLDFGIAKATSRSVETQSGIIKGKFAYMAPEQCRGRDVDRRSDVFSLGIILYEITTQHRCFRADSDFDTMHRIVTGDIVRPTRVVQGYPQALEAIVMKALATDPSTRYQSAGALLEAIESFAVSSRMSLSTMSLGRFMRDMFGDSAEPWLTNNARASAPIEPKESTISNTNNAGASPSPKGPRRPSQVESEANNSVADKTVLMPESPPAGADGDGEGEGGVDWNAPTDHEPMRSAKPFVTQRPSGAAPSIPAPAPAAPLPTLLGTGRPPAGQFHPGAGSASGPSHAAAHALPSGPVSAPVPIASTRHGYASGGVTRGDTYPRLEASEASASHPLSPNRRPLFIGLGLAAVGLIVLLVMTLGGGGDEHDDAEEQPIIMTNDDGSAANAVKPADKRPEPPIEKAIEKAPAPPVENKLANPMPEPAVPETKSPEATPPSAGSAAGSAQGSADSSAAGSAAGSATGSGAGSAATDVPATSKPTVKKPATTTSTTKPKSGGTTKPKQADCQPAGQYNGFDPRPVCK